MPLTNAILFVLDANGGVIEGTQHLAFDKLGCFDKEHIIRLTRRLMENGCITITHPGHNGRGHKTTYTWHCPKPITACQTCTRLVVRKRNPNSAGSRRRAR